MKEKASRRNGDVKVSRPNSDHEALREVARVLIVRAGLSGPAYRT
jgi:hypothetical protein